MSIITFDDLTNQNDTRDVFCIGGSCLEDVPSLTWTDDLAQSTGPWHFSRG
jgi:hypothetical protein